MDVQKRRAAARQEIREAAALIDVARKSVYGVPELFVARIEMAVARLELLENAEETRAGAFRPAGEVEFPEPVAMFEPSVRTRKVGRDGRTLR